MFELRVGAADPRDAGQLATYVTVVDDQIRSADHADAAMVGILLAASRDEVIVQYALRALDAPMAIVTYTTEEDLPDALPPALPSSADLTRLVENARTDGGHHGPGTASVAGEGAVGDAGGAEGPG